MAEEKEEKSNNINHTQTEEGKNEKRKESREKTNKEKKYNIKVWREDPAQQIRYQSYSTIIVTYLSMRNSLGGHIQFHYKEFFLLILSYLLCGINFHVPPEDDGVSQGQYYFFPRSSLNVPKQ